MPLFSARDMAVFRTLKADLGYHDTWALKRLIRVSDGRGGYTTTEQTVATGPGLLRDPSAGNEREIEIAGRLGWTKAAILDAPLFDGVGLPLDIRPSDRLYVNGVLMRVGGETTVAGFTTVDRSIVITEEES
jgi:hypothetical protein